MAAFVAMAVAFLSLMYAFVTSDFSVANVAANSHTDKPLLYKVAGVWGSHEGSMLLWCLALTGFGAAVALAGRNLPAGLKALVIATQGTLGLLFIGYTALASNPFVRLANPPVEGASLNPILQDPFLAIHPPFLYSGYVGFSVVFSFAVAALIEGRVDAAWARWVRPWALTAWSFLTVGITLGSYWAYYELGWGGWWFWDPVENASFMPWLAGTALLHSAIVTEKRGALAGWTAFLGLMAFTFSMLGAFLVRSGVLTSVHAFAVDPRRGVLLLIILGLTAGTAFALFAWRAPKLAPGGLFAPVSREGAVVLNNLFLAAATLTVMLGTLYPLIRQALTGEAISVGGPYFGLTFGPLMCACLLLVPAGPLLAWKRGDLVGVAAAAVGWRPWSPWPWSGPGGWLLIQPHESLLAPLGLALGVMADLGRTQRSRGAGAAGVGPAGRGRPPAERPAQRLLGHHPGPHGPGRVRHGRLFRDRLGKIEFGADPGALGQSLKVGRLHPDPAGRPLDRTGPNYEAERGVIPVRWPGERVRDHARAAVLPGPAPDHLPGRHRAARGRATSMSCWASGAGGRIGASGWCAPTGTPGRG